MHLDLKDSVMLVFVFLITNMVEKTFFSGTTNPRIGHANCTKMKITSQGVRKSDK